MSIAGAQPQRDVPSIYSFEPEVIVTCLKRRFSGVSATVNALLPFQARQRPLAYLGVEIPGVTQARQQHTFRSATLAEALQLSRRRLPDGRRRIWHVRRDAEMLLGLFARDVLRCPIRLVFTSAAIRRHSVVPRSLIRQMDAVIATTPEAAAFFKNTIAVVGHGVDVRRFQPPVSKQAAWAAAGLPGSRGIGIFGRVRAEKGAHLFVRAAIPLLKQFPDVTAVIGGLCKPADEAFAHQLRAEIATARLTSRFIWTGQIPPAEMAAWYQRVSIAVACPTYEGYGLTPLEAMACGCAVVATRTGAFASMVADGQTGYLVPTDDTASLQNAMGRVLADPALTETMGQNGRRRVCELFSIENEATGIDAVYDEVWRADQAGLAAGRSTRPIFGSLDYRSEPEGRTAG